MNIIKKTIKFFYSIALIDFIKSLLLTGKHLFSKKITLQYPEEKKSKSLRFRGLHALRRYSNGIERCIACKLCEVVCPALAISIQSTVNENKSPITSKYEIDLFKCIYCGLCEEACPVDAIVQTSFDEYHFEHRGEQILTKEKLLAIGDKYEKDIMIKKEQDAIFR